jgi:hypothetical protein
MNNFTEILIPLISTIVCLSVRHGVPLSISKIEKGDIYANPFDKRKLFA